MAAHGEVLFQLGQNNESDIWDDTALIAAYDKAINSVKAEQKKEQQDGEMEEMIDINSEPTKQKIAKKGKHKRKKRKSVQKRRWKVGDKCSAVFADDNLVYESIIKSVNYKLGTCWVTYTGYGNEEEKDLDELMAPGQEAISQEEDYSENGYESFDMDTFSNPGQSPYYMGGYPPQRRLHPPRWPLWDNPSFPPQVTPPFNHVPFGTPPPPGPFQRRGPWGVPHPPPPPPTDNDQDALYAMLMAWYMSGYHTGYFQGMKGTHKKHGSKTEKVASEQKEGKLSR